MASTTKLSQQLHRPAAHWPGDPFRPHLQLGTFLKALADHPQLTPHAVRAAVAFQWRSTRSRMASRARLRRKISGTLNGLPPLGTWLRIHAVCGTGGSSASVARYSSPPSRK